MTAQQLKDGLKAVSLPLFLALMSCLNLYAFVMSKTRIGTEIQKSRSALDRSSDQVDKIRLLLSELPTVVSNLVVSSSPSNLPNSSTSQTLPPVQPPDPVELSIRYHYMVIDGYPAIRYYGRNFSIGSPFRSLDSRIVEIFPDRVILSDGTVLRNTFNPDVDGPYFSTQLQIVKVPSNDRS